MMVDEQITVYLFSHVLFRVVNKKYNHFDNLFEFNLYEASTIVECNEVNDELPMFSYKFTKLSNVNDCKGNDYIGKNIYFCVLIINHF